MVWCWVIGNSGNYGNVFFRFCICYIWEYRVFIDLRGIFFFELKCFGVLGMMGIKRELRLRGVGERVEVFV